MKAKQEFTEEQKREVAAALKSTRNKEEYQRVQAVWLRMTLNLRAADIAEVLGLHIGSVWRIHARFFREGSCIFTDKPHGGRYRENLTAAEEKKLLSPFVKNASESGVLVVSGIKKAYEKVIGHKVPKSTVYRMLERNGWRKLVPRPNHPDADSEAQTDFKKTSH